MLYDYFVIIFTRKIIVILDIWHLWRFGKLFIFVSIVIRFMQNTRNKAYSGGHYWNDYFCALSLSQVSATYLKMEHPMWMPDLQMRCSDLTIWQGTRMIALTMAPRVTYPIPGPWFNIKIPSNQYRKSHCGDKTVLRSSYLHNGISYAGKTASLYWIGALISFVLTYYNVLCEPA